MPAEYKLKFPIEAQSPDPLNKIADAMRSTAEKTKISAGELKRWTSYVKQGVEEGFTLNRAVTQAGQAFDKAGGALGKYTTILRDHIKEQERLERQADQTSRVLNRVETRAGAGIAGVPLPFGLQRALPQLLPGMGGGILAAGAGIGAAVGIVDQLKNLALKAADYGREIENLSAKTGLTNREAQIFSRTIEVTGGNVQGLVMQVKTLSKALTENSDEGRKAKQALAEIGLSPSVAFQGPGAALSQIYAGISKAPDFSRERIATTLLGRQGVEALPYAGQFGQIQGQINGLISNEDIKRSAEFRKNLTLIGIEWENLTVRMGAAVIKALGGGSAQPGQSILGQALNAFGIGAQAAGFGVAGSALSTGGQSLNSDAANGYRQSKSAAALGGIETRYYAGRTRAQNEADAAYFAKEGTKLPAGLFAALGAQRSSALAKIDEEPYDSSVGAQEKALRGNLRRAQSDYSAARDAGDTTTGLPADDAVVRRAKARVDAILQEIEALKKRQQVDKEIEGFNERMSEKELNPVERVYAERDALAKKLGISPDRLNATPGAAAAYDKMFAETDKRSFALGIKSDKQQAALFGEAENKGLANFDKDTIEDFKKLVRSGDEVRKIQLQEQKDEILRRSSRSSQLLGFQKGQPGAQDLSEGQVITESYKERLSLARELANVELESASKIGDANERRVAEAKAIADFRKVSADAELEKEIKIAQLEEQSYQKDKGRWESLASGAAGSLISGGSRGFQSFLRGKATSIGPTIAGNLGGLAFDSLTGGHGTHLPESIVGTAGSPTLIGKLLKGTGFEASPLDKQVVAQDRNTSALDRVSAALERMGGGGDGSASGGPDAGFISKYLTPGIVPSGIGAPMNFGVGGFLSAAGYASPGGALYDLPISSQIANPMLFPGMAGGGLGTGLTGGSVSTSSSSAGAAAASISQVLRFASPLAARSPAAIVKGFTSSASALARLGGKGGIFGGSSASNDSGYTSDGVQKYSPENYDSNGNYLGAGATGGPDPSAVGASSRGLGTGITLGQGVAAGVGIATGGFTAFQGFSRGGGQGISEGISGTLGAAAAAALLIPGGQFLAPFLAGGAGVAGLTSALFGDPRTNRQNQINRSLEQNQFYQPVGLNVSASVGGYATAYDRQGNLVSTTNNPYPSVEQPYYDYRHHVMVPGRVDNTSGGAGPGTSATNVTIQAMDAGSFMDFAQNNGDALAAGVVASLQSSGGQGLVETLRPYLGGG